MKNNLYKLSNIINSALIMLVISNVLIAQNITDCYSRSSVIGDQQTAGFAGHLSSGANLQNVYSAGLIITDNLSSVGGLVSSSNANVIVQNSYWDKDYSGITLSLGGSARSTDNMSYPYGGNTYTGWNFVNIWQQDNNNKNHGYPFLIGKSPTLFSLDISANNTDFGTVKGDNTYSNGETVIAEAITHPGFKFVVWKDGSGQQQTTDAIYVFFMPASDHSLEAIFDYIDYTVNVNINPPNSGSVSGIGTYHINDQLTLNASASEGFRFLNWTDLNDNIISEEMNLPLTIATEDILLTANFEATTSTESNPLSYIRAYPNPFSGVLNIADVKSQTRIKIFGNSGKLILDKTISEDAQIDTNGWAEGSFMIHLTDNENKTVIMQILKLKTK